jgi:hypothetical protein
MIAPVKRGGQILYVKAKAKNFCSEGFEVA